MLEKSVISSSSDRCLFNLVQEIHAQCRNTKVDLYLIRPADLIRMEHLGLPSGMSSLEVMADSSFCKEIVHPFFRDVLRSATRAEYPIAALATHFPSIADSGSEVVGTSSPKSLAMKAIENSIHLACDLVEDGLMKTGIVEIVCGNIVQRAKTVFGFEPSFGGLPEGASVAYSFERKPKLAELLRSLKAICAGIDRQESWAIALELEPGELFTLNDEDALKDLCGMLSEGAVGPDPSDCIKDLQGRVGLNVDIAHMKIAKVAPSFLESVSDLVVHAHICDTPGQHTRDQPVGEWNPVERIESLDYEFLEVLRKIQAEKGSRLGLPYSNTVALELEGCNRIRWILESLSAMDFQFRGIASLGAEQA